MGIQPDVILRETAQIKSALSPLSEVLLNATALDDIERGLLAIKEASGQVDSICEHVDAANLWAEALLNCRRSPGDSDDGYTSIEAVVAGLMHNITSIEALARKFQPLE